MATMEKPKHRSKKKSRTRTEGDTNDGTKNYENDPIVTPTQTVVEDPKPSILNHPLIEEQDPVTNEVQHTPSIPHNFATPTTQTVDVNPEPATMPQTADHQDLPNESQVTASVSQNLSMHDEDHNVPEQNLPSAPVFDEPDEPEYELISEKHSEVQKENHAKLQAMPLHEAMQLYCEREMSYIRSISEKEEALVEAGPNSSLDNPLVDLLSTFKRSIMAVERLRHELTIAYNAAELFHSKLWKIKRESSNFTQTCKCGADVHIEVSYETAELLKDKLPVARSKLEMLLRDVQEGYCHQQHAALSAHCQIEELLEEIVQGSQIGIREALSLILHALRSTHNAPTVLAKALTRWAAGLTARLHTSRDVSHLLFLIHHLFRQSHSVSWAASVINITCNDPVEASRAVVLLDLLLNRPKLEAAVECTEGGAEGGWEEVDLRGRSGGVAAGRLREGDLRRLLAATPLHRLAAAVLAPLHARDVTTLSEQDLIDPYGGQNVLKSCYGARTFLSVVKTAISLHSSYEQLQKDLITVAVKFMTALAHIHLHLMNSNSYQRHLVYQIATELEAIFDSLAEILTPDKMHLLPTSLLTDLKAMEYCNDLIGKLHESSRCRHILRTITSASIGRPHDPNLASTVATLLLKQGCKTSNPCKLACYVIARQSLPLLLEAHPYLQTIALHTLADLAQTNTIDPAHLSSLCLPRWRPGPTEINAVLENWARSCPGLLQHLLLDLEYTPHVGVSLETQLAIGSFLCDWLSQATPSNADWPWAVLRKLRPHRTYWNLPLDVPPPEKEDGLFAGAFALLSSSWGHCIPLICTSGVSVLLRLSVSRADAAVHCLGPIMLVMQASPESVSLTKEFGEVFDTLLSSGPTLVQRAMGRGGPTGVQLIQECIMEQIRNSRLGNRSSILSAWLHALWRAGAGLAVADEALRASRAWPVTDILANRILQEPASAPLVTATLRSCPSAPLLCESILRCAHAHEISSGVFAKLCAALHEQRISGTKIHVDKALQQIGSNVKSEDLSIYRCASCALVAPAQHPAHLTTWRLLMHLYLQTPTNSNESTPPVGPLFFSGLIKSRTFAQLKRRLQELITYHHEQYQMFDKKQKNAKFDIPQRPARETNKTKSVAVKYDSSILPPVTIDNLTGESETESGSEEETDKDSDTVEDTSESDRLRNDEKEMVNFHIGAEKMLREYARWLEEGEKTRALPFHADIARYVSETALDAAWRMSIQNACKPEHVPAIPLPSQKTHFEIAKDAILSIRSRKRKSRRIEFKSGISEKNYADAKTLYNNVEIILRNFESLARECATDTQHISTLDDRLLKLVCSLRVPQPLAPRSKSCSNNCQPVTMVFSVYEWCVNVDAENAILENRSAALSAIKKLARPRPHIASAIAWLNALARQVGSTTLAQRVIEAAYLRSANILNCAPAHDAITEFVDPLAERWIAHDGILVSSLLSKWSGTTNPLQQHICGALVIPRKLSHAHWLKVYVAVANSKLPSHVIFSLLSKFEMSRWADSADDASRQEVVNALLQVVQRWGSKPDQEHYMLLELCGVHSTAAVRSAQLAMYVRGCARASVHRTLPVTCWRHVANVCTRVARMVTMDQLGYLLREMGVIWWEARCNKSASSDYSMYAVAIAVLLTVLQRLFVQAARLLTYEPERVAQCSWSSIQESWSPWIAPHSYSPLLPPASEVCTAVVKKFRDVLVQVMVDCPGTELHILQQTFCWLIQLKLSSEGFESSQVLMTSLMMEMTSLPWSDHQWVNELSVQAAVQAVESSDQELKLWSVSCWRHILAKCWLADCRDVAPRLASLLTLFTAQITINEHILGESALLPWARLPAPALDAALHRFFTIHHSVQTPYHLLPQFTVMLYASGMRVPATIQMDGYVASRLHESRCMFVSSWVRSMSDPGLVQHVQKEHNTLLHAVTDLAPMLNPSSGELEDLLSRAIVIMCIEPAAAAALPVWQSWLSTTTKQLATSSLSAVCSLTTLDYFAKTADYAVKAYMAFSDSTWSEGYRRWSGLHWSDSAPLLVRGCLHAAYVTSHACAQSYDSVRRGAVEMKAADMDFIKNEVIIAVYICYFCRIAAQCMNSEDSDKQDCLAAVLALLTWAEEKRSILRSIGLQAQNNLPTANHRLLCRLAQCILKPSDESCIRAFESCCGSVLGSNPGDVTSWGRQPHLSKLVRLAMRLLPNQDRFFRDELELVSNLNIQVKK